MIPSLEEREKVCEDEKTGGFQAEGKGTGRRGGESSCGSRRQSTHTDCRLLSNRSGPGIGHILGTEEDRLANPLGLSLTNQMEG